MVPFLESRPIATRKEKVPVLDENDPGYFKELIHELSGSTTFSATRIPLNPGMTSVFTRLADLAKAWEEYSIPIMIIRYIPLCAFDKIGSVGMGVDRDCNDPPPTSLKQLSAYAGSVVGRSATGFAIVVRNGKAHFVRDGLVTGDLKTYDIGNLFVCVNSQDNTDVVGNIEVEGYVRWRTPQTNNSAVPYSRASSMFYLSSNQALATGVGEDIVWDGTVNNGLGLTPGAAIVLPKGYFRVFVQVNFNDDAAELLRYEIRLKKDTTTFSYSDNSAPSSGGSRYETSVCFGELYSDGTDELHVEVEATGAAGTLTAQGNALGATLVSISAV